jgi:hypothetical protein
MSKSYARGFGPREDKEGGKEQYRMNPQMQSAIFAAVLSICAGVVGYFFREYRQRAKPFLALTKVTGGVRASQQLVDVPDAILDPLNQALFINPLNPKQQLEEVEDVAYQAAVLSDNASDIRELLDQALEATSGEDMIRAESSLAVLLSNGVFEGCILRLISSDKLEIPRVQEDMLPRVQTFHSEEYGGSIYIAFQGAPVNFGRDFTHVLILKEKCLPFVRLIEVMDLKALNVLLREIKAAIESELPLAKEVLPQLNDLLESNSRWELELYLANLGKDAFLVSTEANLRVQDNTGAGYEEICRLSILDRDEKGDRISRPVDSPLIVSGESGASFCYVTSNVQQEMERGAAFREAFVSGKAKCWVEFQIEKIGLVRRKKVMTPSVAFTETGLVE